jgi:DDB1- and CUL4-associated factor 7
MPFHSHHSSQPQGHSSIASGLQQAGNALGAIGAPSLRTAGTGTTNAGTDILLSPNQAPQMQPPQHQSTYAPPQNYSTQSTPGIGLQPDPMSSAIPGSLQAGGAAHAAHAAHAAQSARPPPPQAAYTAPTTVPTVPQINTNASQYTLPTRSNTINMNSAASHSSSHSYSRSSPAGLEQKYIPFNQTPQPSDGTKYTPQTPQQKFFSPATPTSGGPSNSPLALDQIRPRANSNMNDDGMSGTTLFSDLMERAPTNSNYLAPWGVFAFDWCKYPVPHGNSAGRMAIGSYTEEPHNFVGYIDTTSSSSS